VVDILKLIPQRCGLSLSVLQQLISFMTLESIRSRSTLRRFIFLRYNVHSYSLNRLIPLRKPEVTSSRTCHVLSAFVRCLMQLVSATDLSYQSIELFHTAIKRGRCEGSPQAGSMLRHLSPTLALSLYRQQFQRVAARIPMYTCELMFTRAGL